MKHHPKPEVPSLLRIDPAIYHDARGFFLELYHAKKYGAALGSQTLFVQDNLSVSKKNALRGLHYQVKNPQAKLVTVLRGQVFDVAVDMRPDSPSFGRWYGFELDGNLMQQLFIPAGFAHGFCVTSDEAVLSYKCTDFYNPADEAGIFWQDPSLNIQWPCGNQAIVSEKDQALPRFADIPRESLACGK